MTYVKHCFRELRYSFPIGIFLVLFLSSFGGFAQQDCCDEGEKPATITLTYTGEDCSATNSSQKDDKVDCSGDPNFASSVYIVASDKKGDEIYFAGTVSLDDTFTLAAANAGKDKFKAETFVTIYSSQGGSTLQAIEFHTSCSQPLIPGEQVGSAKIEGVTYKNGVSCGVSGEPPTNPPGADCCDQGNKPVLVTFQYTGQSCSETNTTQQDNKFECSGDANDDPSVYIIATDKNGEDVLFAGEIALGENYSVYNGGKKLDSETLITIYASQGGAVLQELNIHTSCSAPLVPGENIGSALIEGVIFEDGTSCGTTEPPVDPPFPPGSDCCDEGNKPVLVTFTYTGQSCSETNTTQQDNKFECSGDANDDPSVYIIATDKNGEDVLFAGEITLGENYSVYNGGDKLDSETLITIYASQGGAVLQELNIHTSCSAPLVPGENIGSALIEGVIFEDGTSCGTTEPPIDPPFPPGSDCCDEGNKPVAVTFTYTGESCSETNTSQQDNKFECSGDANDDPSVYIVATDKKGDEILFAGEVTLGGIYTVANGDRDKLDSETLITIYASQGGAVLQELNIHTSCSAPLIPGENIGSARIEVVEFEDGTVCGEIPELPCLGDFVFEDLDRDGVQDIGEPGVENIVIELYQCTNGVISNTVIATTVTDSEGFYEFCDLQPGEYAVKVAEIPDNFTFCVPDQGGDDALDSDIDPATGFTNCVQVDEVDVPTVDIGIKRELPCLGDFVFEDLDRDGIQDAGEPGVENIVIELYQCTNGVISNTVIATTVTDSEGFYEFCDLQPGEYAVKVAEIPDNFTFCVPDQGGDDALDSDVDPATGFTNCVQVDEVDVLTVDIGIKRELPCLGDFVFEDLDRDGIQDAGEPGVENIVIELYQCTNGVISNTVIATTVTNSEGFYEFCDLQPGEYAVKVVEIPDNFTFCVPDQGGDDALDSDVDPATGFTNCVQVDEVDIPTVDIGIKVPVELPCLGDFVFNDLDQDGTQDAGEPGVGGIELELYLCDNGVITNTLVGETVTNSEGFYEFCDLKPGEYAVKVVEIPDNFTFCVPNQGGDDALDSDVDPATGFTNCVQVDEVDVPTVDIGIKSEKPPVCDLVNVALGKETEQSSTYGNGAARLAVDGNTVGISPWSNPDLQHTNSDQNAWWSVDLGQVFEIKSVKIFNRTNKDQNRLKNFYIHISEKPFASDDLDATLADTEVQSIFVTETPNPMGEYAVSGKGRYVRIQLKGKNFLHMAEVMVIACDEDPPVDVCEADPGTLTPDITGPICFDDLPMTLSATPKVNPEVPAGYKVAYLLTEGEELLIEGISDNPSFFVNVARKPVCCIHTLVYDPDPNSPDYLDLSEIVIAETKAGDLLDKIAIEGICAELDVEGACFNFIDCEEPGCESKNLALGKATEQSSTYGYGVSGIAVDGNTTGIKPWNNPDLQHTNSDVNAWWSVDLGQVFDIETVKIFNRTNKDQNRLKNFYIHISDTPFESDDLDATLADTDVQSIYVGEAPNLVGEYAIQGSGRYVRVQLKGKNFLHMAEVMVIGCEWELTRSFGYSSGVTVKTENGGGGNGLGRLTVGPNPILDGFTVAFDDKDIQMDEIIIMNTVGQVIETKRVNEAVKAVRFDSSSWSNGIYLMKVSYGNQSKTFKLIKN